MADVIDPDPANTEEFEFAIFDLDAVRGVKGEISMMWVKPLQWVSV